MSLTSARVGTARLHMLSSIWVTTMKGTPAARQAAESCFWQRGSSHSGMALPRSPRAMTTSSTRGRSSGRACTPVRFSIFAKMRMPSAPASCKARRRVRISSAPRTKGSITPVTPHCFAIFRFCRSSSVRVGEGTVSPGAAMLLRLCSTPPRSTVQVRASGAASVTCTSSLPSSSRSCCPGLQAAASAGGHPTPPRPSRRGPPSGRVKGCASRPVRSSGPCRSMSSSRMPAARMRDSQSACSTSDPWERFMRMPVMPASTICRRVSGWAQAGPMVP